MATWRQAFEVAITDEDVARPRSRTEPASRVQRAQMLLAYRENPSFYAIGQRVGVHHQTVQCCIERALAYGPLMALDDRPDRARSQRLRRRPKPGWCRWCATRPRITAIRTSCGRRVFWRATRASTGGAAGHGCLANLVQGTVCKILGQEEIKPHKVRYHLERRGAEFEQKMAEVLCVYREVQVLKKAAAKEAKKKTSKTSRKPVAIVSYDEKPGIQAIATTSGIR